MRGIVNSSNVFELKETTYVSSVGLGCFISAYTTAIKHGGRLAFMGITPEIRDIFGLVGLTQIMRFAKDRKSTLKQFKE